MDTDRHDSVRELMRWFGYDHLATYLHDTARPFAELARDLLDQLPDSPELTTSLRKLLEAKDCAIRAAVAAHEEF